MALLRIWRQCARTFRLNMAFICVSKRLKVGENSHPLSIPARNSLNLSCMLYIASALCSPSFSCCSVEEKTWQEFVPTYEQLQTGLCANVKSTLFYPGFPTFVHIEHRSYLQKMGVTVFQQASRGENRIVQILDDLDIVCVSVSWHCLSLCTAVRSDLTWLICQQYELN